MKTRRKKSFFTWIILLLNQLAVLALLLVYAGVRISPADFWPLAFAGLVYPAILTINILFIAYWLIRFRLYFLISLIAILLGWPQVKSFFQWSNTSASLPEEGKNISVVSYNVRVFDLYNYGPRWELNFTQRNNIFRFLQEKDFDIICFQEFVYDKGGSFKTLDTLPDILRARHAHAEYSRSSRDINFFGVATFSAWPIIHKGTLNFPSQMGNMGIYSDIVVDSDTIRVYNVHFESIGLSPEDYGFVESLTNAGQITQTDYLKQGSLRILNRLKQAYIERTEQVKIVSDHISSSPYPVILTGDFNDTPASWTYREMTRNLSDAFKSGTGLGQTYIGAIPGFRIDYILHSNEFTPYNFNTGSQVYSDHYPVWVWLNIQSD